MNIKLFHVGASTCVLDFEGMIKVGIDPSLSPLNHKLAFKSFNSSRLKAPKYDNSTFENIDIWLITHPHEDHIDSFGEKIISSSTIISDKKTKKSTILNNKKINVLNWGEDYIFEKADYSIKITAIPAYHGNSWIKRTLVGKVNGYLLEITNGTRKKTIYFTSDTVYHKNVIYWLPTEIDILVANLGNVQNKSIGGPLTMNLKMLNLFIKKLNPQKVIPIHIDDFSHYNTSASEVEKAGFSISPLGTWITL